MKSFRSHGSGRFSRGDFRSLGVGVVFEEGVRVFHPETITLGSNIYVGHDAILKGYYRNAMVIGDDTWIGQQCFFHSAGGLVIGEGVGIGPGVRILTSSHRDPWPRETIMEGDIHFSAVRIDDGADLGVGAVILPGVHIGRGVQVGAGAVVTRDLPDFAVAAGNPAKILRLRGERSSDEQERS